MAAALDAERITMLLRRTLAFAVPVPVLLLAAAAISPAQTPKGKAKDAAPRTEVGKFATVAAARGTVVKADKDSLTIRPRGADGRFDKELTLHLTGTSRITQLTFQTRGGKSVAVQQDTDAKSIKPDDAVAVIYTDAAGGSVLLSAVVQSK
jgi:hypothetical protein